MKMPSSACLSGEEKHWIYHFITFFHYLFITPLQYLPRCQQQNLFVKKRTGGKGGKGGWGRKKPVVVCRTLGMNF